MSLRVAQSATNIPAALQILVDFNVKVSCQTQKEHLPTTLPRKQDPLPRRPLGKSSMRDCGLWSFGGGGGEVIWDLLSST